MFVQMYKALNVYIGMDIYVPYIRGEVLGKKLIANVFTVYRI